MTTGGFGLQLQPRDMAKLGYLYLKSGAWAGRQIVPSDWVAVSVTKHSVWEEQNRAYGYLWWLYPAQGYYSAMGQGGQQIHIVPKLNLVVVFTSALNSRRGLP
jgi:CubicO group peptidase (beta-lactamase class C family)